MENPLGRLQRPRGIANGKRAATILNILKEPTYRLETSPDNADKDSTSQIKVPAKNPPHFAIFRKQ